MADLHVSNQCPAHTQERGLSWTAKGPQLHRRRSIALGVGGCLFGLRSLRGWTQGTPNKTMLRVPDVRSFRSCSTSLKRKLFEAGGERVNLEVQDMTQSSGPENLLDTCFLALKTSKIGALPSTLTILTSRDKVLSDPPAGPTQPSPAQLPTRLRGTRLRHHEGTGRHHPPTHRNPFPTSQLDLIVLEMVIQNQYIWK